jgi:cellulose synthase/poly-beta-1,6-N-acetylglucosamine synthase-like glycosyltransferase
MHWLRTIGLATPVALGVAWFSARRLGILAAALLPPRTSPRAGRKPLPTVTLLVPAHNEAATAPRLLEALDSLVYPAESLSIVLVCDGCTDETPDLYQRWSGRRTGAQVLETPRLGKAGALNGGLRVATGEIVLVCDADLAPRPDFVVRLVAPFADPRVAAVAAFLHPVNAFSSTVSRYAALETWVTQLVGSAGKDRLDLNPPTFGACAYRRSALTDLGGFWTNGTGEDVESGLALVRAGWRTRFLQDAVADNAVAATAADFWRQRIRWGHANLGARNPRRLQGGRIIDRIEGWNVSFGYLDRLFFLASISLAATRRLSWWVPAAYLAVPGLAVGAALLKAGAARDVGRFARSAAIVFPLDVAASASGVVLHLLNRRNAWSPSRDGAPPEGGRDA